MPVNQFSMFSMRWTQDWTYSWYSSTVSSASDMTGSGFLPQQWIWTSIWIHYSTIFAGSWHFKQNSLEDQRERWGPAGGLGCDWQECEVSSRGIKRQTGGAFRPPAVLLIGFWIVCTVIILPKKGSKNAACTIVSDSVRKDRWYTHTHTPYHWQEPELPLTFFLQWDMWHVTSSSQEGDTVFKQFRTPPCCIKTVLFRTAFLLIQKTIQTAYSGPIRQKCLVAVVTMESLTLKCFWKWPKCLKAITDECVFLFLPPSALILSHTFKSGSMFEFPHRCYANTNWL